MASSRRAIPRACLIIGDEPELVYKALAELVSDVEDQYGDDIERITFQAGQCSIQEVVGTMSQSFMFSSRALIVLRDPSSLSSEDSASLLSALESYEGDNVLILANFSGSVDSKLRAHFSNRKTVIDATLRSRNDRTKFLGEVVQASGLHFDPDAYRLLAQTLGEDVARVVPTLDVLKASLGEGARVDSSTMESYLPAQGDIAPWDFTDAIEAGRVKESLEMAWRLMGAGRRHPLVILAILQRRYTELATVLGEGIDSPAEATAALKARDKKFNRQEFVVKKILSNARLLGYPRVAQAFVWLSQADRQIKGEGGITPELAIELLVARLAKSNAAHTA